MAKRVKKPTETTIGGVAKHFGVSRRAVQNWFSAGCPRTTPFDLRAIEAWRDANRLKTAKPQSALSVADLQRRRLENQRQEERLQRDTVSLVLKSAVSSVVPVILAGIVSRLEQLPAELTDIVPLDMQYDFHKSASSRLERIVFGLRTALEPLTGHPVSPQPVDVQPAEATLPTGAVSIEELRRLQIDVARKRLRLQRERGQLFQRADVHARQRTAFTSCRTRLEDMPTSLGGTLPPEIRTTSVRAFRQIIHTALMDIASQSKGNN